MLPKLLSVILNNFLEEAEGTNTSHEEGISMNTREDQEHLSIESLEAEEGGT